LKYRIEIEQSLSVEWHSQQVVQLIECHDIMTLLIYIRELARCLLNYPGTQKRRTPCLKEKAGMWILESVNGLDGAGKEKKYGRRASKKP
jgi:hypothetical protein